MPLVASTGREERKGGATIQGTVSLYACSMPCPVLVCRIQAMELCALYDMSGTDTVYMPGTDSVLAATRFAGHTQY